MSGLILLWYSKTPVDVSCSGDHPICEWVLVCLKMPYIVSRHKWRHSTEITSLQEFCMEMAQNFVFVEVGVKIEKVLFFLNCEICPLQIFTFFLTE